MRSLDVLDRLRQRLIGVVSTARGVREARRTVLFVRLAGLEGRREIRGAPTWHPVCHIVSHWVSPAAIDAVMRSEGFGTSLRPQLGAQM